jgi:fido (protein-threonine AMPylation protein)
MQNKVSNCVNPEQVIKVASSLGFKFSREDLRHIASDLYAEFFPWAGKGTEYRVNFFKDQSAIRKKSRQIIKSNRTELPKVSFTDSQIHALQ